MCRLFSPGRSPCLVIRLALLLAAALPAIPARAETLLLCGMSEVFEIDSAAPLEKRWSWRAADRADIPAELRKTFATTDDCKPVAAGKQVLISSSSGGCALVERPSGRVLWFARVPNAHSIELLPRDRSVVASSVHPRGNKLVLFDVARPEEPLWETALPSAHGVVWDAQRQALWALGFDELRCYALQDCGGTHPALALTGTYPLPEEHGHELQPVPGGADLALSTQSYVYLFDREARTFRLHPTLGDKSDVKCVATHPESGRLMMIRGEQGEWWSHHVYLFNPDAQLSLPDERLYKGRWLPEQPARRN